MRLKKLIMINRAPFERLELEFDNSNVILIITRRKRSYGFCN